MRLAVTGTPGVGKTTLAALAGRRLGWPVLDVLALARGAGAASGPMGDEEVDVDALVLPPGPLVVEGHLAHLLAVDEAWVVRVDPEVLRGRLAQRGYADAKVQENLEAEALDLILQEALERVPVVVQRDGTRRSPDALLQSFVDTSPGKRKSHDLEEVDWSHRLPV